MIAEIEWTNHARRRLLSRRVSEAEVAVAIQSEHAYRVPNAGDGDWLVPWVSSDGRRFEVVYDHPVYGDRSLVRVVTVLRSRGARGR
jgi:hypothetical protein